VTGMSKLEDRQWMNDTWQAMAGITDRLFRRMQMGDMRGFLKEMTAMVDVMQDRANQQQQETGVKQRCQTCDCWKDRINCTNKDSPYFNFNTGAGWTCDEWTQRKEG
jgi:hypothetical protein